MYVTRRLSRYLASPELLSEPPSGNQQQGPNSGFLVIQDQDSEATCCFGLCTDSEIRDLPLPQNKILTIRYSIGGGAGVGVGDQHTHRTVYLDDVFLIPALDQPLSSNRYYAILTHGRHRGEAYTNSREAEMGTCCFCRYVKDVKPTPLLNPHNPYQQVVISPYQVACSSGSSFQAKSVAPDGFPPHFLRRKGFKILASTARNLDLEDAPGLDAERRARMPDFDFPLSQKSSPTVVVGKWYCPFMFIRESGMTLKDQAKKSLYYGMALEQRWELIYECVKDDDDGQHNGNSVELDCLVKTESVWVGGYDGAKERLGDGFMWFGGVGNAGEGVRVGLGLGIWERMRWELERAGVTEHDGEVEVKRVEEVGGLQPTGWKKVGFYVLVERFVLRRMDESLVLCYDSKHTHQIRSKWE